MIDTVRKGMPSRKLNREEFDRRFKSRFRDPNFDSLQTEIAALADPKLVAGDFPITPVHEPRKLPALTGTAHRLDGGYLARIYLPAIAALLHL